MGSFWGAFCLCPIDGQPMEHNEQLGRYICLVCGHQLDTPVHVTLDMLRGFYAAIPDGYLPEDEVTPKGKNAPRYRVYRKSGMGIAVPSGNSQYDRLQVASLLIRAKDDVLMLIAELEEARRMLREAQGSGDA